MALGSSSGNKPLQEAQQTAYLNKAAVSQSTGTNTTSVPRNSGGGIYDSAWYNSPSGPYISGGGGPRSFMLNAGNKQFTSYVTNVGGRGGLGNGGNGGFGIDLSRMGSLEGQINLVEGDMITKEGTEQLAAYSKFDASMKSLFSQYSVTPKNIKTANTELGTLMADPSKILDNPLYRDAENRANEAQSRQLIAQGFNPAESGLGAAALQESAATRRLDSFKTAFASYMDVLGLGSPIAQSALDGRKMAFNVNAQVNPWGNIYGGMGVTKTAKQRADINSMLMQYAMNAANSMGNGVNGGNILTG